MSDGYPKIWLLKLVLPGRWGGFASALLIVFVLMGVYQQTGIFDVKGTPKGVVYFFVAILAYTVLILPWVVRRAEECRDELLTVLDDKPRAQQVSFDRRSLRWQFTVIGIGVVAWIGHTVFLVLFGDLGEGDTVFWYFSAITIGSFLVWITVSSFVAILFSCAAMFQRFASDTEIDLFQIEKLSPFAQIATVFMLALVGAQAAFPLMLIEGFTVVGFVPGWLGMFIPMLILMAMPVWPIHKAIVARKTEELLRVNAEIENERSNQEIDINNLAALNPLLAYRREISDVHEWPFDLGFYARLGLYLLIPPLTWVGAALIENLVDMFV